MEKFEHNEKEVILATAVANCWIEKKLPSSKHSPLDKQLQEFKRAAIEKILKERPYMIHNGNIFFKGLPHVPAFPWMFWTYVDWENFKITTKQGITLLNST